MAQATRYGNVIVPVDTNTISGPLMVQAIKVVGGAAGATVNLRDASNNVICKVVVGNNASELVQFPEVLRLDTQDFNLNISAGAADVYIYLK